MSMKRQSEAHWLRCCWMEHKKRRESN
jgi:hypothetical protein